MEDFIPYKKWLHLHDEEIRREFPDRPTAALAREMGVNYYTVSRRATRMGVGKTAAFMRSSWKAGAARKGGWKKGYVRAELCPAADEYMKERFADTRNEDLARFFGVDVKTVRRWARRLGLAKSEAFMRESRSRGCCANRRPYYTDEQQAWRRRRVAEVYPDGDGEALRALAEELGISAGGLQRLAWEFGIRRSEERLAEARRRPKRVKYGPETIAALREYYTDHTAAECAARFGIPHGVVKRLAVMHGMRKSREHISRIRSRKKG